MAGQPGAGRAPTDAGGLLTDVDGDKDGDIVAGSAWYRNPGNLNTMWQRFDYDPENAAVHDQVMVDIDKDGRLDLLTMSDRNNRSRTCPRVNRRGPTTPRAPGWWI